MNDLVNHPDHYVKGRVNEPIDVLLIYFPTSPLLWQVGKYLSRYNRKGDPATDLGKALWYLDKYTAGETNWKKAGNEAHVEAVIEDWLPDASARIRSALYSLLMSVTVSDTDQLTHLEYLHITMECIEEELEILEKTKSDYSFAQFYDEALRTVIYDDKYKIMYPALGLAGETGEVAEKIKKLFRDKNGEPDPEFLTSVKKELGDVLWYIAALCRDLDIDMADVALSCIVKLKSRQARNVLQGNGDER